MKAIFPKENTAKIIETIETRALRENVEWTKWHTALEIKTPFTKGIFVRAIFRFRGEDSMGYQFLQMEVWNSLDKVLSKRLYPKKASNLLPLVDEVMRAFDTQVIEAKKKKDFEESQRKDLLMTFPEVSIENPIFAKHSCLKGKVGEVETTILKIGDHFSLHLTPLDSPQIKAILALLPKPQD